MKNVMHIIIVRIKFKTLVRLDYLNNIICDQVLHSMQCIICLRMHNDMRDFLAFAYNCLHMTNAYMQDMQCHIPIFITKNVPIRSTTRNQNQSQSFLLRIHHLM